MVIRGGKARRIAGREVVRGDMLVLTEGDRVPADVVLLSCINLSVITEGRGKMPLSGEGLSKKEQKELFEHVISLVK